MRKVARLTTATGLVLLEPLADRLHLALLAVSASELQASHLEGAQAVAQLYDVDQAVEVVGGEDKAVSLLDSAPSAKHQVSSKAVLQRPCQVFVEDRVEVVIVCTRISNLELAGKSGVAVVRSLRVVVSLPKLDRSNIRADEDGAAEQRVERGGEERGEHSLEEKHGGVGNGKGLCKSMKCGAPVDLMWSDVGDHELALQVQLCKERHMTACQIHVSSIYLSALG